MKRPTYRTSTLIGSLALSLTLFASPGCGGGDEAAAPPEPTGGTALADAAKPAPKPEAKPAPKPETKPAPAEDKPAAVKPTPEKVAEAKPKTGGSTISLISNSVVKATFEGKDLIKQGKTLEPKQAPEDE